AGAWLRQLHQLPVESNDAMSFSEAMLARLAPALEGAKPLLDDKILTVVDDLKKALKAQEIDGGTRVFAHRDFRPRNWFVKRDVAFCALDFEHARVDFIEWDLVRMIPDWHAKPTLKNAFFFAYKDPRQDISDARLRAAHLVSALQTIAWGVAHEHD